MNAYPDFLSAVRISAPADLTPETVPSLLEGAGVSWEEIAVTPWPKDYPYRPSVQFRIAHDGGRIFLEFKVSEATAAAAAGEDQGEVWKDSCVEFFVAPMGQKGPRERSRYYNFECSCIGKLLLNHGVKGDRHPAPAEVTSQVLRWSSLGTEPFAERGPVTWSLVEIIPVSAFFEDVFQSLTGKAVAVNFYKCGDNLRTPHFVAWAPISTPAPDFHRPEFFRALLFE